MAITHYGANTILNFIFGAGSLPPGRVAYWGCFAELPGREDPGREISGNGYERRLTTDFWTPIGAINGFVSLGIGGMNLAATADWDPVVGYGFWDAISGGNLWLYAKLPTPIHVVTGEEFADGPLDLYID